MLNQLKALADENRMRIFHLLLAEELCVCEIETMLEVTQSNASRHLTKLRQAGLITSSKDAQWVHYKVSDEFRVKGENLISYLNNTLTSDEPYVSDLKRLRKYQELGLTCTDIRKDSVGVITLIQED
ncbi:winged helix-turn-helix transcriptional regulator [Acidaminobacter sp. JC074]|uniref:ArsR/SmtB family transcription factor n=1 Tax=Acidaminobacter sp. JC074 TaxID=2530199 RepID=UPI001F0D3F42|nr:metalloregulator ArsR/SmtB family transcription factor [Acidaminobacter sp. JC074]MCH4887631.1 winged helix-turn-helix transcriptional regulator [Acidaminobacter sp. JC074]